MEMINKEAEARANEAIQYVEEFGAIVIKTDEVYSASGEILKQIKQKKNILEEERKKMTVPLDDAKKAIMDFFRRPITMLENLEGNIKANMLAYYNEKEKARRAEEQRQRDIAAEEERKAKAKIDKEIAKAEAKGQDTTELEMKKESVYIPPAEVAASTPKVAGVSARKVWTYKIVNRDLIPKEYMIPNEALLRSTATSTKGTMEVPGVVFYQESSMSARV